MRISVITPSYNQGRYIERTVRSVLDQTGEFELEYLLFDGGSTDETLRILRRYEGEGQLHWRSEPDRGQVDAINKGLRQATGDIVGWINSDDTLSPGALALVAATFQHHPEALWVHGRCELTDEQDRPIRRWIANYKHRCCLRYSHAHLLTENFIHQPSVFWRRAVMEQIGVLDPRWEWAMDYEWFLRLARLGPAVYIPERYACLRWHAQSKSARNFARQLREVYAIARTHDPGRPWHGLLKRYRLGRIIIAYGLMCVGRVLARPFTRQATKGH